MAILTQALARQFIIGISLIIIFISITHTPINNLIKQFPYWFLIGGILLFIFDRQIAEKIKK